jgi:hypothetical protein
VMTGVARIVKGPIAADEQNLAGQLAWSHCLQRKTRIETIANAT